MRVALVFTPYTHKIFSENIATVDEEFCLAPPIILAYVAAILEQAGHTVMLLDACALNLTKEQALAKLRAFDPDMLGLRAETYHFHDALAWVRFFKEHLRIPVVAGGINMSLYPRETMSHPEIDYGVIGDALDTLPELLRGIESKNDLLKLEGIAFKRDEQVVISPAPKRIADFDAFPFPARHLLPNEKYYSFISQLKNFTIMLTSTGCPYRCSFCAIHPTMAYRLRSPKKVVDEIEQCYQEFGVREIDFFDATFFLPRRRAFEMFEEIKRRRLKIEWSCRSRVDVVDKDVLRAAKDAGCRQIYFGIESVDHDVLGAIKKDVDTDQIRRAIAWAKGFGIRTMGFFMVGNPHDTKKSIRNTIDFAKHLGVDFIQVCRTIAKPGTELDRELIKKTGKDYWRAHVAGKKMSQRLPTPWTSLSMREVDALTREFYHKFYFRLSVVLARFRQLKSCDELMRYVKVGSKMLTHKSELYSPLLTDTCLARETLKESRLYVQEAYSLKLAVVIPTYNEQQNIQSILAAVRLVLPQAEIVVVDDNSPDGTADAVSAYAKNNAGVYLITRSGPRGLGYAYKEGFRYVLTHTDANFIVQMDADLSHNPEYIPLMLHYARTYDLVTGSRFLKRVSIEKRALWRNLLSKTAKWFVNLLLGIRISDVTTGYKCFRREALASLPFDTIHSRGYAFQIEVTWNIYAKRYAIKEIPILFIERAQGESKMSLGIMMEGAVVIWQLFLKKLTRGPHR